MDLPLLPADEQAALDALDSASIKELEAILRVRMSRVDRRRMQILMCKNNFGKITAEDRTQLARMIEQEQRLMLRKANAMALLTQRGHPIDLPQHRCE